MPQASRAPPRNHPTCHFWRRIEPILSDLPGPFPKEPCRGPINWEHQSFGAARTPSAGGTGRCRRNGAAHRPRAGTGILARAARGASASPDDHHVAWGGSKSRRHRGGDGPCPDCAEGWVAAFPEGRGNRWNFWPPGKESAKDVQFFQQHGGLPDDVAFIRALVADLVRRGISDPKRIYIAGLSLGGVMALRMACVDAGTFAAIGLLIATMSEVTGAECRPSKPLPLLTINGTADPALPSAGGPSVRGDNLWSATSRN